MEEISIKKNVIYNTLYQVLTVIIPLITTPYIARVIGSTGVGIYSYTTSIQTYFSMFAVLGTATYGAREIARNRNNRYKRSKLFWEIELLTVITSCIAIFFWIILIIFSTEYKIYYTILIINLLNTMFDISWFYTGLERFKYIIIQNSIFKILGTILLFVFIKQPSDLKLYIEIMSLFTFLGTISTWIYLPKFLIRVNIKELKIFRHVKETVVYFVPTIATSIYTVLDKTLIGIITQNANENGYYEQATQIINVVKLLTFVSLNTVLGSRNSYLFAEKKYDEIRDRINASIDFILFVGIGAMFGLISVAGEFVPLFFGPGYEKVIGLVKVLSPLAMVIGISNCLGSQYYNPAGLRAKSSKFIIAGAIINLILNIILIPKFWSYGACIATIIAETVITSLYLKYCDGFLKFDKLVGHGWKKMIAGFLMFISIYWIQFLNLSNALALLLQLIIGIISYIIFLTLLKDDFIFEFYRIHIKKRLNKIMTMYGN